MNPTHGRSPAATDAPTDHPRRWPASGLPASVQALRDLEIRTDIPRDWLDRWTDRLSAFAGGRWFIALHIVWFTLWVAWNMVPRHAFDPYPFTFLTFLVSLEAILLTSIVLSSQADLERQSRQRAKLDLQVDLLAEAEMTTLLRDIRAIAQHLGVSSVVDDADTQLLAKRTDVTTIAESLADEVQKGAPGND